MKLTLTLTTPEIPDIRAALKELFPTQTPLIETRDLGSQIAEMRIVLDSAGFEPEQIGFMLAKRGREIFLRNAAQKIEAIRNNILAPYPPEVLQDWQRIGHRTQQMTLKSLEP